MFKPANNFPGDLKTGFIITQAVVDGVQDGVIYQFKDNFIIVHKSGFASIIGDVLCESEIIVFLQSGLLPQYFHLYNPDESLRDCLLSQLSNFNIRVRKRLQFEFKLGMESFFVEPAGFYVADLNNKNFDTLAMFNLSLEDKFWRNRAESIEKSLGKILFNDAGEPIALCYAAAIAGNRAEIDVITAEKYRGNGFGKLVVSGFINRCKVENIKANWDCFEDNFASVKTALALNFKMKSKYLFMSLFKSN